MAATAEQLTPQKSKAGARLAFLLIGTVAAVFGCCELGVRVGLTKVSQIERRTAGERRAALAIRGGGGRPQVLVVGNSLLLFAMDFPRLQRTLAPEFAVRRYVIEQTAYWDWYYGMRALYAQGARPDVVVVMLSAGEMIFNGLRGDYSAYRMIQARDTLDAAEAAKLSPTATFSLWLAHFSAFYGTRAETRKALLSLLMPPVEELRPILVPAPRRSEPPAQLTRGTAERMKAFDRLVREHGGRFLFLGAPVLARQGAESVVAAGARAGVPVVMALRPETLTPRDFLDGEHMTPAGAARYTTAVIPLMRGALQDLTRK